LSSKPPGGWLIRFRPPPKNHPKAVQFKGSTTLIYFFSGLAFEGLGLAAFLQQRQGSDLPLNKHLKWLAAFGFVCGVTSWIDMFLTSGGTQEYLNVLNLMRMIAHFVDY